MGVAEHLLIGTELWTGVIGVNVIILTLLYFFISKKKKSMNTIYINENRINDWKPYPLVDEDVVVEDVPIMGKISEGVNNMGATSFLSIGNEAQVENDAIAAIRKYGVGSCGPRGFYGTIDVHLELEERLANFMGVEEVCVYSYGFSTIASAIPAYAKKDDLIFVDERVHFAIQKGLNASRSKIFFYRHNDMTHLEELLKAQSDKILKKRSFIVAESIYFNTGELCPLPKLVELRKKYKLRLILDESLSIGVIGDKGRGSTEYFNVAISDVDLIVGSLEHSFGSTGGFCAGSHFIVEHQRLSGLGYCFSASLPPLLSQAAITSLNLMETEPIRMEKLRTNSEKLNLALGKLSNYLLGGHTLSPIKHLYLRSDKLSNDEKQTYLKKIAQYCAENGIALSVCAYLQNAEVKCLTPSIRVASNSLYTDEQISNLSELLTKAYKNLNI